MTTSAASRIVPVVDDRDTGGFFQAAQERRLVVKSCHDCGAALHLPRAYCYHCGSWNTGWRELDGRGTLYAWTVVEQQFHPAYEVPYTVVLVDVAAGVRLVGNVPGRPDLTAGQAMELWWDDAGGVVLPNWTPAAS